MRYQDLTERLIAETDKRTVLGEDQKFEGLKITDEEMAALRQLAIRLVRFFGPHPQVDLG